MVSNFEAKLHEYAHLLVEVGMNLQPGQTPRLAASTDHAPLARLCAEVCYDRGARDVVMDWTDDTITRLRYLRADEAVFGQFPPYTKAKFDWLLEHSSPALTIEGSDPELLRSADPGRILTWQRTAAPNTKPYLDAMETGRFQWCIGAHPTLAWAEKVFPDKRGEEAMDALWDAIFTVCRVTGDGKAVERWRAHTALLTQRCEKLNDYNFKSLHYTNSLGTDLTVQLPENHLWAGACEHNSDGTEFVPNMPTEEIFTAPRWDGVDGRVYAAMPLALHGNLIEDFYLDFEGGRIVDFHAGKGEEVLKNAVDMDEGSRYLGEAALVPYDSPIRNSGVLFFNTLFDENASCHLAFGSAYPTSVKGGADMTPEQQKAAGLNQSDNHVDFMIGTADLSIVGTTHDGKEVPVFINGNFAF